jgi:molecular chaperone GrpE
LPDESPAPDPADPLLQRARLAEERLAEILAAYRTLKNENEGHRDRITRNLERRYDQRRERLLLRFIEILDNFDRALESAERSYLGDAVIEGLIMVRTQLLQTLQEEGLERIPVVGLPYDPAVSEAVGTEPVSDPDHHHVVLKDLQRGYRLNGRVARASRVVVGEYREGAAEPDAPVAEPGPGPATDEAAAAGETREAPETEAGAPNEPEQASGAAAEKPGKKKKEITFSKLSLDIDAAIHEAADAATELDDDDTFAEIMAEGDEGVDAALAEDDATSADEKKDPE